MELFGLCLHCTTMVVALNKEHLKQMIYRKLREINFVMCQTLMRQVKTKLRRIEEHVPLLRCILTINIT